MRSARGTGFGVDLYREVPRITWRTAFRSAIRTCSRNSSLSYLLSHARAPAHPAGRPGCRPPGTADAQETAPTWPQQQRTTRKIVNARYRSPADLYGWAMSETLNAAELARMHGWDSEVLLRTVADSVPALWAYYAMRSSRCLFASKSYAQAYGLEPDALIGRTARDIVGEALWEELHPRIARVMAGETVSYTRRHLGADGESCMMETTLSPHGQQGVFVAMADVTRQWVVEQSMRQSEERLRKFFNATDEAIIFHRKRPGGRPERGHHPPAGLHAGRIGGPRHAGLRGRRAPRSGRSLRAVRRRLRLRSHGAPQGRPPGAGRDRGPHPGGRGRPLPHRRRAGHQRAQGGAGTHGVPLAARQPDPAAQPPPPDGPAGPGADRCPAPACARRPCCSST